MSIFGWPYTLLISVIIGVTNIIPFFGPFLSVPSPALLLLMEDPWLCLYFSIFILILQQVDGNIIGPTILGDSTGLGQFLGHVCHLGGGRAVRIFGHGSGDSVVCGVLCLCMLCCEQEAEKKRSLYRSERLQAADLCKKEKPTYEENLTKQDQ